MVRTVRKLSLLFAMLSLLVAGAAPVAAASDTASAGGWDVLGQHTVVYGESLYCIGRAYGVDPAAIALQNDVNAVNLIHPGDVLDIPNVPKTLPPGPICAAQFGDVSPSPEPATCGGCACRWTHTVSWGDTLSWISISYGVDMYSIAQCNCIYNLNYIQAGDSLCIP